MTLTRDTHCSYCGARYEAPLAYPRTCKSCLTQVWANPIPVAVLLLPVVSGERTGLLVVRRAIEPRLGKLALVGGFLEEHETWAQGAVRELREETGVELGPDTLEPYWFTSTEPRPNRVLLFCVARPITAASLGAFVKSSETDERGLVFGPAGLDEVFAFPLHVEAARRYFAGRGVDAEHGYVVA